MQEGDAARGVGGRGDGVFRGGLYLFKASL